MPALCDARRAPRSRRPRGRLPGARRGTGRAPRRGGRLRGGVQLLPGQEPGRDRRRRRRSTTDDDAARRRACARCASTASGGSTATRSRATRPGSTRSRRSCSCASCRSSTRWNEERRAAAAFYSRGARRRRRPAPAAGAGGRPRRSGTSTSCARRAATRLAALPRRARHRRPAATIRSRRISRRRTPHLGYGRGAFPVAEQLARRGAVAADLPGHHEAAARRRRRARCARSSTVADGPANDAPYRLISDVDVRRGRGRAGVHEPLRLPDRRRTADRPVRRDPARSGHRRALQDPEPHVRLRRRRRSRTRCSSATASCSSTTSVPRATTDGRRAADRGDWELAADGRRARARASARAPSCSAASRSAPARWSAPAPSSRATSPRARPSRACPPARSSRRLNRASDLPESLAAPRGTDLRPGLRREPRSDAPRVAVQRERNERELADESERHAAAAAARGACRVTGGGRASIRERAVSPARRPGAVGSAARVDERTREILRRRARRSRSCGAAGWCGARSSPPTCSG